jgi:glyoxylase-like metal-dependent hydrolase (beta-lactamase superfamily II)
LTVAVSIPRSSAATANSTSSRGQNCSADALYPSFNSATYLFYPVPRLAIMEPVLEPLPTARTFHGEAVNYVLVTDDTGVMLIDAGYPGDKDDLLASLRKLAHSYSPNRH